MQEKLSAELQLLERELLAFGNVEPPPRLRQRVAGQVARELAVARGREKRRSFLVFAGQMAAVFALGCNLAWSASRQTTWDFGEDRSARVIAATEQIQSLLPDLSPQEARRQALLLSFNQTAPVASHAGFEMSATEYLRARAAHAPDLTR